MVKIPEPHNTISNFIDAAHEARANKPRHHMGISILGGPCERAMWLSFRWAVQEKFLGRILRLFRRGHQEEANIISDLRAAGLDVKTLNGKQERVHFGAHVSGSIDAIITAGVPEAPKKHHIAEFKTHSLKSFTDLEKRGVQLSKPQHYAQMQGYMLGMKIDRALYVAVCKDNDKIYTERVRLDKTFAEKLIEKGRRLALADRLPPPISTDPSWYQCKFCPAHEFCHVTQTTQHVNCRTCAHSTAMEDSTWRCELHDANDIPVEFQHEGCPSHVLHPDLVPWKRKPDTWTYIIDGKEFPNGAPDETTYTSKEILNFRDVIISNEDFIKSVRETFPGAEIVK